MLAGAVSKLIPFRPVGTTENCLLSNEKITARPPLSLPVPVLRINLSMFCTHE